MAVKKVIEIEVDGSGAISGIDKLNKAVDVTEKSTKSLRQQLKEATAEVAKMADEYGATAQQTINAAKRAADLRDRIEDANDAIQSFKGEGTFLATGKALQSVASGFTAAQGAIGLFGVESENVEKAILRVNSALALSQGLAGLEDAGRAFTQLGASAKNALAGIRSGIAATGIGVLLVAVGTLVAYWDDIKEAVSGVSSAQEELNEKTNANYEVSKKQLDTLNDQDNTLKLQGKSEKEILQIKIKQYNETIKIAEANLKNIKITNDAAIKGAERNFSIFKKILQYTMEFSLVAVRAIAFPLELMINGVNKVSQFLSGKKAIDFSIEGKITEGKNLVADFVAGSLFNVEEVKQQGEEEYQKALKEVNSLKNKRDGLILELNKPSEKAKTQKSKTEKAKTTEIQDSPELIREQMIAKTRMEMDKLLAQNKIDQEKKRSDAVIENNNKIAESSANLLRLESEYNQQRIQERYKMLDDIAFIFGAESDLGKAALIAKQILMAKELAMEISRTITFANLTGAKAVASSAAGAAETAKIGFPQNIPMLIGYAAQAAGIIGAIKSALGKVKTAAGSFGGGISSGSVSTSVSPSPQFNLVNNTGVNQIATTLAGQQPVKAYVVAKEVTTAQELDRNKITSTKLG